MAKESRAEKFLRELLHDCIRIGPLKWNTVDAHIDGSEILRDTMTWYESLSRGQKRNFRKALCKHVDSSDRRTSEIAMMACSGLAIIEALDNSEIVLSER